jgi:hypothetical protein
MPNLTRQVLAPCLACLSIAGDGLDYDVQTIAYEA